MFLYKVNKSRQGSLHNMNPHDAYGIPIQLHKLTLVDISYEKKELNPVMERTVQ